MFLSSIRFCAGIPWVAQTPDSGLRPAPSHSLWGPGQPRRPVIVAAGGVDVELRESRALCACRKFKSFLFWSQPLLSVKCSDAEMKPNVRVRSTAPLAVGSGRSLRWRQVPEQSRPRHSPGAWKLATLNVKLGRFIRADPKPKRPDEANPQGLHQALTGACWRHGHGYLLRSTPGGACLLVLLLRTQCCVGSPSP